MAWVRRAVTVDGRALYAMVGAVVGAPEFVMASLADLAERGIKDAGDALPVPVGVATESPAGETVAALRDTLDAHLAGQRELETLRVRVAELEAERHSTNEALSDAMVERSADKLTRLLAPTQALREDEPADEPPLTVYRASHESFVMGLYTTRQAAYEHCEAHELRDDPVSPMAWNVDEDGAAELVRLRVPRSPGAESATGYVVTPLEIASAYDEEADE
ncbi:hypothetical protein GKQ77_01475 [Streptomyces sp. BG9H]|uniref:Uncharacterized protein n=1 Tax=Streptomyces anatolicus TaxID=2675858 RepID=A0ABS6YGK0_9ACTN|nr:hypothetical protein [Streptomyces anatolicus]MBW5420240.1 hypothetical protein [Streptomyces anatolicus]